MDEPEPYDDPIELIDLARINWLRELENELEDAPARDSLKLARREQSHFKPGYFFMFLPANCQIELNISAGKDIPGPGWTKDIPMWEEIHGPSVVVGTLDDNAPDIPKDKGVFLHMRDALVSMQPKAQKSLFHNHRKRHLCGA